MTDIDYTGGLIDNQARLQNEMTAMQMGQTLLGVAVLCLCAVVAILAWELRRV